MNEWFRRLAKSISDLCATWQMFIANVVLIAVWLACGPFVHWSDTWQLICNTVTTVITYLLVFLVMNTQARDAAENRIKIDALIVSNDKVNNALTALEHKSEAELKQIQSSIHTGVVT